MRSHKKGLIHPISIQLLLIFLFCLCAFVGCGRTNYEQDNNWAIEIADNTLFLVVGHAKGYKTYRNGMSHQTGVTVTQQQFCVLEYDLGSISPAPLRSKSARFLFSAPANDRYEVRILDRSVLAVHALSNGNSYLEKDFSGKAAINTISVSSAEGILGSGPFVFTRSNRYFIPMREPLTVYDSRKFTPIIPNPLGRAFEQRAMPREASYRQIAITDDLEFVTIFPERNFSPVIVYDKFGTRVEKALPAGFELREVEHLGGELKWLCQTTNTLIGSFDRGAEYKIEKIGFPRWDAKNERVLLVPWGFDLYERRNFEMALQLWSYKEGRIKEIALDFADLQKQLSDLRKLSK